MTEKIIKKLIDLSEQAIIEDESPISAIITYNNEIIAEAYNKRNQSNITTDHAEIMAITIANKKLNSWRLNKCTLYVTIEPCEMCKTVIKESRIEKCYYLIPRLPEKKQYNKTKFVKLQITDNLQKNVENYQKKVELFWKNKR